MGITDVDIGGRLTPVCSWGSCSGRCTSLDDGYCFCDDNCINLGDCCFDYGQYCYKNGTSTPPEPEVTISEAMTDLSMWYTGARETSHYECLPVRFTKGNDSMLMVTRCRSDFRSDLSRLSMCEHDTSDFRLNTPVYYRNNVYKNIECLRCNDDDVIDDLVISAIPNYRCNNATVRQIAVTMYKTQPVDLFYQYIYDNCDFLISIRPLYKAVKLIYHFIHCHPIRTCNQTHFNGTQGQFEDAQSLCISYRSLAKITTPDNPLGSMYYNTHCALCNGVENYDNLVCYSWNVVIVASEWDDLPSFSMLLDFTSDRQAAMQYNGRELCPSNQYLNMDSMTCTALSCEGGDVLVQGQCVQINASILPPEAPLGSFPMPITLLVHIEANMSMERLSNLTSAFLDDMTRNVVEKQLVVDCRFSFPWLEDTVSENSSCVVVKMSNKWYLPLPPRLVQPTAISASLSTPLSRLPSNIIVTVYVAQFDLLSIQTVSCTHSATHNVTLERNVSLTNEGDVDSKYTTDVIILDKSFRYDDFPVGYTLTFDPNTSLLAGRRYFALICTPVIMTCETVIVKASEVEITNATLTLSISGDVIEDGHYAVLTGGDFLVCKMAMDDTSLDEDTQEHCTYDNETTVDLPEKPTDDVTAEVKVRSVLTVVGNCLSPLFLAFTILTYLLFKPLRTTPGLSIMNLSISLFLAQVVFQVSSLFRHTPIACTVVAAVQHYLWLVTFLWMNFLAYVSFKTFSKSKTAIGQTQSARFRFPLVYTWGIPLVFVGACVIVERFSLLRFQYGGATQCWIVGSQGLIYLFAVPLATIIAANLGLFIGTLVALNHTMDVTDAAVSQTTDKRRRFAIYVKLSTLMGFTWLFGFLGNLTILNVFWYLFIVFNTLQGVFICASFTMNRRVMRLYRGMCGRGMGTGTEGVAGYRDNGARHTGSTPVSWSSNPAGSPSTSPSTSKSDSLTKGRSE